ncbi:MAG: hypothetical protein EOP11_08910 [Proteobacteria bacterium]|nr:MAG: hypothetical protein EOP11_08910 [Pseudomonadota bacterium]
MQQKPEQSTSIHRPLGFYFLMIFLAFGVSFIGWNFGGVKGALIGFFLSSVVNIYALQIKND